MNAMDSEAASRRPIAHLGIGHALLACCIFDPGPIGETMARKILDLHSGCAVQTCVLRQRARQVDDPAFVVDSEQACAVSDAEIADAVAAVVVAKGLIRSAMAQRDQAALVDATLMLVEAHHSRMVLFARACPGRGWVTTALLRKFKLAPVEAEPLVRTLMRTRSALRRT